MNGISGTRTLLRGTAVCAFFLLLAVVSSFHLPYGVRQIRAATTLAINNISVSVSGTSAVVTWDTTIPATGEVRYGLSAGSYPTSVSSSVLAARHSLPLNNLSVGTTYHYQIVSTTPDDPVNGTQAQSATSQGDRFFTTNMSGGSTGSLPQITFGPRNNASNTKNVVTFKTNVATDAMVEYSTVANIAPDPGLPGYQMSCDSGSACPPPAIPIQVAFDHSVTIAGFSGPPATYRYKITIIDSTGNLSVNGPYTFTTAETDNDHIFTTGGCDDGTPIGQCNGGLYCRSGGGPPVPDCRSGIPCQSACPGGSTCQSTGDCTNDPALNGSPTQCNAIRCYQKCDASTAKSGQACTADSDCDITDLFGNVIKPGKCITGSFTTPAAAGCYASWPQCNANIILKVQPDRVCDEWLTCKTSQPVKDETGKTQNQCFDLAACNSLSSSGQCNGVLDGRQCSNDPLRFCQSDADCIGAGATCLPQGTLKTITYSTPQDVSQIRSLSGYAQAGLDWPQQDNNPHIEGYYPLSLARQVGELLTLTGKDTDFEDFDTVGKCSNGAAPVCYTDADCQVTGTAGTCVLKLEYNTRMLNYWEPYPLNGKCLIDTNTSCTKNGDCTGSGDSCNLSNIIVDNEGSSPNNLNHFLIVTTSTQAGSGARTNSTVGLDTSNNDEYYLTVRMRAEYSDTSIQVSLMDAVGTNEHVFGTVTLSTGWKTYRLGSIKGIGGPTNLAFRSTSGTAVTFFVDDVTMEPSLKVNDATYLKQDCRLFPNDTAPACDYTDTNYVTYHGFRGYCLQRDPGNDGICLNWWPVDTVAGSNQYGSDAASGYNGRRPLYFCAQTESSKNPATDPYPFITVTTKFCNANQMGLGSDVTFCGLDQDFYNPPTPGATYSRTASGYDKNLSISTITKVRLLRTWDYNTGSSYPPDFSITADQFRNGFTTDVIPGTAWAARVSQLIIGNYIVWVMRPDDTVCYPGNHQSFPVGSPQETGCLYYAIYFNKTTGGLLGYNLDAADHTGNNAEAAGFDMYFYTNEACVKVVQVANATQDAAWSGRVNEGSAYKVPGLNYLQSSDLAPFGAIYPPNNGDPSTWGPAPLSVEGPDASFQTGLPYQARGGASYACSGFCGVKVCETSTGTSPKKCTDTVQCGGNDDAGKPLGGCLGNGQCLKYDDASKGYSTSSSRDACTANRNSSDICPVGQTCCTKGSGEVCVGGTASSKGTQLFSANLTSGQSSMPAYSAQYQIQRLFAKSFGVWTWNFANAQYEKVVNAELWDSPTQLCKSCSGTGTRGGKACSVDGDCFDVFDISTFGSKCEPATKHPEENANNSQGTADYCAIKPTASLTKDMTVAPKFFIDAGNQFTLKFTATVDPQQLPLTGIRISWGDNSDLTRDDNLSIAPRSDPANPFAYTHTYNCSASQGICDFQIRIRVKDNWGWCNNGTNTDKCSDVTDTWLLGPVVRVRR